MTVQKQVIVSGVLLIIMFFAARFYVGRALEQQLGAQHISTNPSVHRVKRRATRTTTPSKKILSALTSASVSDPNALIAAIDDVSFPDLHDLPVEEKTRILRYLRDAQRRIGADTPTAERLHQALTALEQRLQKDWGTSIVITDLPPTTNLPPPLQPGLDVEESDEPR